MHSSLQNETAHDRRTEPRLGIVFPVKCFKYCVMKEINLIDATVADLSSAGLCLKLSHMITVHANLCIRFDDLGSCPELHKLPDNIAPVLTVSEVKWCRKGTGPYSDHYYAGVKHLTGDYD